VSKVFGLLSLAKMGMVGFIRLYELPFS